jgi:predicted PhzF superfamily epimerase YddE/YHI9
VFESQPQAALAPDMTRVAEIDVLGVICTVRGEDCDFVSRFFARGAGLPQDPVTGSVHCSLIPYWADRRGKREMFARQISWRGGEAAIYLRGTITL